MLLPHMKFRKFRLGRLLQNYPLYDPPHKVEERLLSREKAVENFDYFMRVRQERVAHFKYWLLRNFGVAVTADEKGVRALNRWGNKYAGLLLDNGGPSGESSDSYFTYEPPWNREHAIYNVLFDLGITFGEIIITNCPRLRWSVDPISAILPRQARKLREARGVGFQRPMLTGFDDPIVYSNVLYSVYGFSQDMMSNLTTFGGFNRYRTNHRRARRYIRESLLNIFKAVMKDYPTGDPYKLRQKMSSADYFRVIDRLETEGDDECDGR